MIELTLSSDKIKKALCIKIKKLIEIKYNNPLVTYRVDKDMVIFTVYDVTYYVPIRKLTSVKDKLRVYGNIGAPIGDEYVTI